MSEPRPRDSRVSGLRNALETLRVPHFAPLFGSTFLQQICGQIMMMAMQWLVITQLTESRTLYTLIGFLQGGIATLLSPIAGVVADRVAKRTLLVVCRLGLVAIVSAMAALVQTDVVTMLHVYVASVLGGVLSALMQPASQTFVFDVVGRERVANAIALNATGGGIAQIFGPAAAAILLALIGVAGAFAIGATGLLASAGLLLAVPIAGRMVAAAEVAPRPALHDLAEGFRWMWGNPPVRLVILGCTMAVFNGALGPMRPIFAHHVLDVGEAGLGGMGVAAGVGTMLAALWLASLPGFRRPGIWILGSLWIYALCLVLYAAAFSYEWILAVEFLAGFSGQVWNVTVMAGLQLAVPEAMRGRVIGIVFMVAQLGFVGQPVLGWLADTIGDRLALAAFGVVPSVVLALVLAFGMRTLRRVGESPRADG